MKIKKTYEVTGDGGITVSPTLDERKEGNEFRRFLRKLLQFIPR